MKKSRNFRAGLGVLAAASVIVASMSVMAEGPHDKAIKARQAMFQIYSFNTGILAAMAKEKMPYDAEVAKEAASNLNAAANLGQSQMWPMGSDSATEGNATNRALAVAWETYPAIEEKNEALKKAAATMAAVAGDGLGALQGAMGDLGGSCKGCHDDYRAEKK